MLVFYYRLIELFSPISYRSPVFPEFSHYENQTSDAA
jgi:hypothetical protein